MVAISCDCSGVRSSSFFHRWSQTSLPPSVQNGPERCIILCAPRFMATAPAIAPVRKTSVIVRTQVNLEAPFQTPGRVEASIRLLMVTDEGKQHLIAVHCRAGFKRRAILVHREDHF